MWASVGFTSPPNAKGNASYTSEESMKSRIAFPPIRFTPTSALSIPVALAVPNLKALSYVTAAI